MKVLVLGSDGFIGRTVSSVLAKKHTVYKASRDKGSSDVQIDLLDPQTIKIALNSIKPDVIINCAGVVENNDKAKLNMQFTRNLLESVVEVGLKPKAIIICGSAAEYGVVDSPSVPINEDTPLKATSPYGVNKKEETLLALKYRETHQLNVIVARIFNPIGKGMHSKFLISSIARQVRDFEQGKTDHIEISRLDSRRDYINVDDIAKAIELIIESEPKYPVYNLGSGVSTSNEQLLNIALSYSGLKSKPKIIETFPESEPEYAAQADISRVSKEFNWRPTGIIEKTVKEAMDD